MGCSSAITWNDSSPASSAACARATAPRFGCWLPWKPGCDSCFTADLSNARSNMNHETTFGNQQMNRTIQLISALLAGIVLPEVWSTAHAQQAKEAEAKAKLSSALTLHASFDKGL